MNEVNEWMNEVNGVSQVSELVGYTNNVEWKDRWRRLWLLLADDDKLSIKKQLKIPIERKNVY